jgi:hypothetical protein
LAHASEISIPKQFGHPRRAFRRRRVPSSSRGFFIANSTISSNGSGRAATSTSLRPGIGRAEGRAPDPQKLARYRRPPKENYLLKGICNLARIMASLIFGVRFMDIASFLKMVPAVIGIAGLLTYMTRERKPVSAMELVNVVQGVRNVFVLIGCVALILLSVWLIYRPLPPDRDARLSGKGSLIAMQSSFDSNSADWALGT